MKPSQFDDKSTAETSMARFTPGTAKAVRAAVARSRTIWIAARSRKVDSTRKVKMSTDDP